MKDMVLYHGSRGGIDGKIQPISRVRCDFGKGFYMGENLSQVKGLISESDDPVLYKLRFRLSDIPEDRIKILTGKEWMYCVLANRKKVSEFNELSVASDILTSLDCYDVIIGPIADDRMNVAMREFSNGILTDEGLLACLQYVNYGNQVVAKTEFACSCIDVLSERDLDIGEIQEIQDYTREQREKAEDVVRSMRTHYRNNGLYIDEIVQNEVLIRNNVQLPEHDYNNDYDEDYDIDPGDED